MYIKYLEKPKDLCINSIHSALLKIPGISNLETANNEIRFKWEKHKIYNAWFTYTGKITFEGQETTKITISFDRLLIYVVYGIIFLTFLSIGIFILYFLFELLPLFLSIILLIIWIVGGAFCSYYFKKFHQKSQKDLWWAIAARIDEKILSEDELLHEEFEEVNKLTKKLYKKYYGTEI